MLIGRNLVRRHRQPRSAAEMIAKLYQPLRVGKRQRPQQNALHQRKNRRRRANAQGQRYDHAQAKARTLAQLPHRVANFPDQRLHIRLSRLPTMPSIIA